MPLAVTKKKNFYRHNETHDPELKNLDGELRKIKIEELKKDVHTQQSVISFCSTNDDMLTVSYEISELIAKKLRPYNDGVWAKEPFCKSS